MSKINKPTNDWAKALFIIYDSIMFGVSMADVLTKYEPCFYKFQARLGEIEKTHPKLEMERVKKTYQSKMDGKIKHYIKYMVKSPRPYILNLYNLINEKGLIGSVGPNTSSVKTKKENQYAQTVIDYKNNSPEPESGNNSSE